MLPLHRGRDTSVPGGCEDSADQAPLISIVVPVYNHQDYVAETLSSLLAQTYPHLELIAVNDGSTDQSLEVLKAYRDRCERRFARFLLIDQENAGVATTLNRGIEAAQGALVYLIASDDLATPDAIASLASALGADFDLCLACGDSDFIDAGGNTIQMDRGGKMYSSALRYFLGDRTDVALPQDFGSYPSLIQGNYVPVGILLRRNLVIQAGGYDPGCAIEDIDLWCKLAKTHRFIFVDRTLCHYRIHALSTNRISAGRMTFDHLLIMLREAGYCADRQLSGLWLESARHILHSYRTIRDGEFAHIKTQATGWQDRTRELEEEGRLALEGRDAELVEARVETARWQDRAGQVEEDGRRLLAACEGELIEARADATHWRDQAGRLAEARLALAAREAALLGSTSWRITRPMRRLTELFRRLQPRAGATGRRV